MMRKINIGLLSVIALIFSSLSCSADDSRTVVILDATAQMSANLGQKRKIDWAKISISSAASHLDPAGSFALWAFGTAPQKKCEGAANLVPLQSASSASGAVDKALSALQPKAARAPAMGTLQAALKSLEPADGKPISAIIIAGTGDDCIGDICSAAGRMHSAYPNAKLTVLGMGMSEQAAANYACAAKAMGGAFTAVKSGTDLERSLRQVLNTPQAGAPAKAAAPVAPANGPSEAVQTDAAAKAAANTENAPAQNDQPVAQEQEKAVSVPQPEPNVILTAVLASGTPPLDEGVTWEIFKINVTPTGQLRPAEAPLWVGGGGQAKAKLPEGRYTARALYGLTAASGEFAVGASKIERTIVLDGGTIAVEALQSRGGTPAADAFFVLYRQKTSAAREELARSSEVPALFHVNAGGNYAVSAFAGLARNDTSVKVEAGKISLVRIALNVGTLEIKTYAMAQPSKLVEAWHQIYPANAERGKEGVPLLRIYAASHGVALPAGSYRIESIYGNARVENKVSVTAGEVTTENVILNAGEAKLNLAAGKSDAVCGVYEAGSDHSAEPVARAAGADLHFILKAGRYDFECRRKGETAPAKQAQLDVVAGETHSVKIDE